MMEAEEVAVESNRVLARSCSVVLLMKLRKGTRRVEVSLAQPPAAMRERAAALVVALTGCRRVGVVRLPQ